MSNILISNAIYLDDVPKEQLKTYIGNGYRSVCYTTDF
jgi:DNA polymerase elongation subunit (family B)